MFIFLDTETTDRGATDRLCQIAFKTEDGLMINELFNPGMPISIDAMAVHHITKESTGQLKTFRVISVDSATTMTITPPLIDPDQGAGADSETQYQNVDVTTASATAAITWLNIAAASMNPFWFKDSIEILPGRLALPENAGMSVMRGTTDSGMELVMSKFVDINTYKTKFRMDVRFGVVNLNPEMSGILLFNQT